MFALATGQGGRAVWLFLLSLLFCLVFQITVFCVKYRLRPIVCVTAGSPAAQRHGAGAV